MMKTLVPTAFVLSLFSAAVAAQSTVTLFGVIDAGVARTTASGAGHFTGLASGGNSTPRLGFRGTEDLGGGVHAGFWLEGQLNNDVGGGASQTTGLDFVRRSTVSLMGNFGEVRLGRDFTATYLNLNQFDTFGQRGIGIVETTGPTRGGVTSYSRTSNSVAYFLPQNLGGFNGTVQYAFGEQPSNKTATPPSGISTSSANATTDKSGNYLGGRLGYSNGPIDIAASYGVFQDTVRTVGPSFYAADYKVVNIGASYDFGWLKPQFLYQTEKVDGRNAIAAFKAQTFSVGAIGRVSTSGSVRAQVSRFDQDNTATDFSKFSVGYLYSLSKRTVLYAEVARINNKGAGTIAISNLSGSIGTPSPTQGGNSTGYIVGVRHTF